MTIRDIRPLHDAQERFKNHFHYYPNEPNEIDFDVSAYIALLDRCIANDFDETIELYGTEVRDMLRKRKPGEWIID